MLFNSNVFILVFLPLVVVGFYVLGRRGNEWAIGFLAAASLFFYGWWQATYLLLLLASILVNFALGRLLAQRRSRSLITLGIAFNLALLGYFKYANFLVDTTNAVFETDNSLAPIALPLAISFFTFQQIAYLVDVYRGHVKETDFRHYVLFVSFFPQLIAGPIVYHKEMMPQFARSALARLDWQSIALGLTLFSFGLFKKVCLADRVAEYASPVFHLAEAGETLTFFQAWGGTLSYSFQIYFDFSGYSDMALGLACLFGIRVPANFFSPYKAHNIVEFWRRWHMTLSRFLRDYLYFPLGGNRRGSARRYVNLMTVMVIGGLWHGAGWTFVIWGGLHGFYLVINHGWHALGRVFGRDPGQTSVAGRTLGMVITFAAVTVAWVFFRAESFAGAQAMLAGMAGLNGVALPQAIVAQLGPLGPALREAGVQVTASGGMVFAATYAWVLALLAVVWLLPNSIQVLARHRPAVNLPESEPDGLDHVHSRRAAGRWSWTPARAVLVGLIAFVSLKLINAAAPSEFIYFIF
jgi:D-alanyl-lipoteichoic acid acyltransferase DltB (MBOAT superfamily)